MKRFEWTTVHDRGVQNHISDLARDEFCNVVEVMFQRIETNTAHPFSEPDKSHWLHPVHAFFFRDTGLKYYEPHAGRNQSVEGQFGFWSSRHSWASLPPVSITHWFSNDHYPISKEPKRIRLKWRKGSWVTGCDLIQEDDLLSCDAMHLWMWCLLPKHDNRVAVDLYTSLQFETLMEMPKYRAMFPELTAQELRRLVFTFHTGGIYEEVTDVNVKRYRNRIRRKIFQL